MESDSKFRVLLPIEPDEPVTDLCRLLQAFFRPESTLLRPFYASRPLQAEVFLPEASAALPELCRIDLESRLAAEDQLRRTAAPFGAAGFATEADVVSGPPIPTILDEISAWHADLTVVRTSRVVQPEGRIGHLTSALSRSAATPILTYRDAPEGYRPRRLLIATDFSESSKAAADWGMAFAELTGAEAHLLYVIARHGTRRIDSDILVREGSAEIGRWRSRIDPAFPRPVTDAHVISAEYPSEGILNFATDSGFDMIVLAGTGRTALGGMLLGSNARAVIRWSDKPVLLVPNSNRVPAASMLSKLQAAVANR